MDRIELDCAIIDKLEDGLIKIDYRDDYRVELRDVQQVDQTFLEISEGITVLYVFMDTKDKFSIFTPEAQKYLSKETELVKQELLGGFAMTIDSLAYRLGVKFYMKFYKPNYNLKIFANETSAIKWLREIRRSAISSQ